MLPAVGAGTERGIEARLPDGIQETGCRYRIGSGAESFWAEVTAHTATPFGVCIAVECDLWIDGGTCMS